MKKLVFTLAVCAIILAPHLARAQAWMAGVNTAIQNGKYEDVDRIAANNPGAQGAIALYLLQQAQSLSSSNFDKAADIFATATPFVSQIPADGVGQAVQLITVMLNAADVASAGGTGCAGASKIFTSGIGMSTQANISAQSSGLRGTALSSAQTAIKSNSDCETDSLDDQISLAQQPIAPLAGVHGAIVPSND